MWKQSTVSKQTISKMHSEPKLFISLVSREVSYYLLWEPSIIHTNPQSLVRWDTSNRYGRTVMVFKKRDIEYVWPSTPVCV